MRTIKLSAWGRVLAFALSGLGAGAGSLSAQAQVPALPVLPDSANVVLVTLDGFRWQEVFNGANGWLLRRDPARAELRRRYGQPTAAARRRALLPFLWDSLGRRGQLLGNRKFKNCHDLTNQRRLSYPGYNELLTGAADDQRLRTNDAVPNPNQTVLEYLNRQPGFAGRVAVFATWDAFPAILNQPRSGLLIEAGQHGHERADSLTYRAARQYLARNRPRVLYLAFGNTDTYAHKGRYGDYLAAAHAADRYLAELWAALQATPQYRGRTTLLVTTDHGRGRGLRWRGHGNGYWSAAHTWLAMLGPGIPADGEVRTPARYPQTRVAGLMAGALGRQFPVRPAPTVLPAAGVAAAATTGQ